MKDMPEAILLRLEHIQRRFPDGFFLNGISMDLKQGEVHVVMGENGSGKSCLMQILSGSVAPDSGAYYIMDRQVSLSSTAEAYQNSIIYIRQSANILQNLSVAENIFYDRMPYSNRLLKIIDYNRLRSDCRDLIRDLDLPFGLDDPVSRLGMAQRQIMGFCRAYVSDARIVILDEPTASLTEHDQIILHTIMERIKQRGAGIIYVSHQLDEIRRFGDRVSVMNKGELSGTLELASVSDEDIIRLMSGSVLKNRYPRIKVANREKKLLQVRHLNAAPVLRDINLTLHRSEILGITGLAGSGRTYLAHCLFGDHKREQGAITIDERGVEINSPGDAIDNGIALVPEDRIRDSLIGCLNLSDNISLSSLKRFSRFKALNMTFLNQVAVDYIRKFNVDYRENHRSASQFGPGSQQKVALAKWIMNRPRIFILDEPTRSLDIPSRVDIYNSMNDLISKGAGVIFISSDIEEVLGMCDRIMVLSEGTFVCDLDAKKTSKEEILGYATGEIGPRSS